MIFFSHIDCTHIRWWSISQSAVFLILYWLKLPWNLLMCLPLTGMVLVLRCQIFSLSISRSLYLLILFYSLSERLIPIGTAISTRRHVFLLLVLNHYIYGLWLFIFLSVEIAKSRKIVGPLASVIGFGCFFINQRTIVFTMNVMSSYFIIPFFIFCLVLGLGNQIQSGQLIQFFLHSYWVWSIFL